MKLEPAGPAPPKLCVEFVSKGFCMDGAARLHPPSARRAATARLPPPPAAAAKRPPAVTDWSAMTALLPATRDKAAKEQRKKLFQRMDTDPSHPGVITRHEACSGVSDLLKAQSPPLVTFDPLPVVFAAFDNASSVHQRRPSVQVRLGRGTLDASKRSQQIELNEFRLFLANLRYYFELYSMFVEMDTGGEGVILCHEFVAAQPQLQAWGSSRSPIRRPSSTGSTRRTTRRPTAKSTGKPVGRRAQARPRRRRL